LVLLSSSSSWAKREVGEEKTVQRKESGGVNAMIKSVDLDNVHLIFAVPGVAECYLVVEGVLSQELHGFQVGMKLVHDCERLAELMFYNVSHCHVVRKPNLLTNAHELSISRQRQHLQRQRSTQTKARTTRREPERDVLLGPRLGLSVEDLERGADAGLAEVPVLLGVEVPQQRHQSRHVHVVVVVEVTEPLFVAVEKRIELHRHLAA